MALRQLEAHQDQVRGHDPRQVHERLERGQGDAPRRIDHADPRLVPSAAALPGARAAPIEGIGAPGDAPGDGARH